MSGVLQYLINLGIAQEDEDSFLRTPGGLKSDSARQFLEANVKMGPAML